MAAGTAPRAAHWMSPVHPQYHIPADKPLHLDVDIELI